MTCVETVSARCHKLTGAICLRLPRDRFIPILKMFPDEEEKIAEAALSAFEQTKSSHAGRHDLLLVLHILRQALIFQIMFKIEAVP